jgi:F0F1-type ATP synthase assembly protein I
MSSSSRQDEPGKRKELFPGLGQVYRDVAPYLTLGFQLAAAVIVFFLAGWWLDGRYGTSPTFQLVGVAVGAVGGMIKFFRTISTLGKQDKTSHR